VTNPEKGTSSPAADGYGTAHVERALFIVDTIRIALGRQACTHHLDELSSIESHGRRRGAVVPSLRNPPGADGTTWRHRRNAP
jgi:hypothetical protein